MLRLEELEKIPHAQNILSIRVYNNINMKILVQAYLFYSVFQVKREHALYGKSHTIKNIF